MSKRKFIQNLGLASIVTLGLGIIGYSAFIASYNLAREIDQSTEKVVTETYSDGFNFEYTSPLENIVEQDIDFSQNPFEGLEFVDQIEHTWIGGQAKTVFLRRDIHSSYPDDALGISIVHLRSEQFEDESSREVVDIKTFYNFSNIIGTSDNDSYLTNVHHKSTKLLFSSLPLHLEPYLDYYFNELEKKEKELPLPQTLESILTGRVRSFSTIPYEVVPELKNLSPIFRSYPLNGSDFRYTRVNAIDLPETLRRVITEQELLDLSSFFRHPIPELRVVRTLSRDNPFKIKITVGTEETNYNSPYYPFTMCHPRYLTDSADSALVRYDFLLDTNSGVQLEGFVDISERETVFRYNPRYYDSCYNEFESTNCTKLESNSLVLPHQDFANLDIKYTIEEGFRALQVYKPSFSQMPEISTQECNEPSNEKIRLFVPYLDTASVNGYNYNTRTYVSDPRCEILSRRYYE